MGLIQDMSDEWNNSGIIVRVVWIIAFFQFVIPVLNKAIGFVNMSNLFVVLFLISYVSLIVIILFDISVRRQLSEAKQSLVNEQNDAKRDLRTAYEQKNEEIEAQKLEIIKWKDRAANYQDIFASKATKLAEEARKEKERADYQSDSQKILDHAYNKLKDDYEKLERENEKLTGNYLLKVDPMEIKITGQDVNFILGKRDDLKNLENLTHNEAYELYQDRIKIFGQLREIKK